MQWETATPVGFPVCVRHNDWPRCGVVLGLVHMGGAGGPTKEVIIFIECTPSAGGKSASVSTVGGAHRSTFRIVLCTRIRCFDSNWFNSTCTTKTVVQRYTTAWADVGEAQVQAMGCHKGVKQIQCGHAATYEAIFSSMYRKLGGIGIPIRSDIVPMWTICHVGFNIISSAHTHSGDGKSAGGSTVGGARTAQGRSGLPP